MGIKTFGEDNLIWDTKSFPAKLTTDEDIVLVIREDIIVMVYRALRYILIFTALLIVRILFGSVADTAIVAFYDLLFYSILALILVLFAYQFHNYYLSLQIVTNKRLIDVDQRGIFSREVNELPIEKIEDVTHKQTGLLQSLFNYGTISVQSAAEISTTNSPSQAITSGFVFENVSHPSEVQSIINNLFHQNQTLKQHQNAQLNAHYMNQMLNQRPGQPANNSLQPNVFKE